jgi:hypothetical protein
MRISRELKALAFGGAWCVLSALACACGSNNTHAPSAPPAAPIATAAPVAAAVASTAQRFDWSRLGRLHDARGADHDVPQQLASARAAVLVFVGTECPLTRAYLPTLGLLYDAYASRGIAFFAVYSNAQDGEGSIAGHASRYGLRFPAVKDVHNELADALAASTTPEAFVVDPQGEVLYRGLIDDQYGIAYHNIQARQWYLAAALDDLIAGRPVAQASTRPQGCSISRERSAPATGEVTYARDVAPILKRRCVGCHAPGRMGPMPLVTYEDAFAWSATIAAQVSSQRMPPWGAQGPRGAFANDPRLEEDESRTLLKWVDEGGPRGEPANADAQQQPGATAAGTNAEAPTPEPEMIVAMSHPVDVKATGFMDYQYEWSDQTFDRDVWVRAVKTIPGAPDVVHHIVVLAVFPQDLKPGMTKKKPTEDTPGRTLSVYTTPMSDLNLPPGYARKIPKGSRVYFQIHYSPNGAARRDQSRVGLYLERSPQHRVIDVLAINVGIDIPPFSPNHEEKAVLKMPVSGEVLGLFPHTHLRGKDFRYELARPDGTKDTILWVPRYDFQLSEFYRFEKPLRFEKGSVFECTAHYDNSVANHSNPDPSREVKWGGQTFEEMLIGFADVTLDLPADSKELDKYDVTWDVWFSSAKRTAVYR